ncbi:hypothetical protein K402DRAFT_458851 [Aulographum hederae CBS 113979]|uniref:Fermentation associated protein n=1 Tax=Aulographum hederae CBS 113979 TaxID=1176131 RepID=A0A6G1HH20_9PEZI|nr:hypothetical protein K402DRAFT_458851 [Aulographum hederae CBS 113979]
MAGGALVSQPLLPTSRFNWVFLVELLVCGILTIFFLFYFDRLLGTVISYGIRAYTWRKYHLYIDIQALQVSLLGGRVFFKGIRYHGHNETFFVRGGYITWRYWLRKVKDPEILTENAGTRARSKSPAEAAGSRASSPASGTRYSSVDQEEKGGKQPQKELPCRISVQVYGLEAFLYNRSPAYDMVVENLSKVGKDAEETSKRSSGFTSGADTGSGRADSSGQDAGKSGSGIKTRLRTTIRATANAIPMQSMGSSVPSSPLSPLHQSADYKPPSPPWFLSVFPIRVICGKGAIIVGNENTKAIISAKFDRAQGEIDAGGAGVLDLYKQLFRFDVSHPIVQMKPNPDFKELQLVTSARLKKEAQAGHFPSSVPRRLRFHIPDPSQKVRHALSKLSQAFSKSSASVATAPNNEKYPAPGEAPVDFAIPGQEQWQGLSRYLEDDQNDGHDEWDPIEYARSSTLVDCERVSLTFYWDIPGSVPPSMEESAFDIKLSKDDINGTIPPEYGLDLQVYGGTVTYGPWADRQRTVFQSYFFPASCADAVPAKRLLPGDTRVNTVFKLFLSVEEELTLRVPMRESSKDWKWKGKAAVVSGQGKRTDKSRWKGAGKKWSSRFKGDKGSAAPNVRPFGWMDVTVSANTTVSYVMDMVARPTGYTNNLGVDVKSMEISTSVNHGILWRSKGLTLDGDISFPLQWNTLREWTFNIVSDDMELFILRDHFFLITDLVADWSTGPPPDYYLFTPFKYYLNIEFRNFKLFLNVNDSNIINNPTDFEDNSFIVLFGKSLKGKLEIPLVHYRPPQNEIKFDAVGRDFGLDYIMPPRNTTSTFLKTSVVAQLDEVTLKGSHNYFTETSTALTDTLTIDIHGEKFCLAVYGFLIRHLVRVKENYFGDDLHFKTLEEFQDLHNQSTNGTVVEARNTERSNDLDVILTISANNTSAMLPANLYSVEENVTVDVPYATVDLRFTNYYMDLMVDTSPLSISLGSMQVKNSGFQNRSGQTEIFIQAAYIYGNRLFGLPPAEPAYVAHWDVDVGEISGECSQDFVGRLATAIQSVTFTVDDNENASPMVDPIVVHDVTILRLKTEEIRIWAHVADEALLFRTDPITLDFNDLAGSLFSQRLHVLVPQVSVAFVDAKSASRHRTRGGERHTVKTHAYVQTSVTLDLLQRNRHFTRQRQLQQMHIAENDKRTNRAQFLLMENARPTNDQYRPMTTNDPPAMPIPFPPQPLYNTKMSSAPAAFDPDSMFTGTSTHSQRSSNASYRTPKRKLFARPSSQRSYSSSSIAKSISNTVQLDRGRSESTNRRLKPGRIPSMSRRGSSRSSEPTYRLPDDDERQRRGLAPSSMAFASPLAVPYFPLDVVQPDMKELPKPEPQMATQTHDARPSSPIFNDVSTKNFDEEIGHTSLVINVDSGLQVFCAPEAIEAVAEVLGTVQSKMPVDMLDAFQQRIVGKLLDGEKRKHGVGSSFELSASVPSTRVRFINSFKNTQNETEKDQYDLELDQIALVGRITKYPAHSSEKDISSAHCTIDTVGVSARERSVKQNREDVAVSARLRDTLLWMTQGKSLAANFSFQNLEVAASSKKVEYLASLIHRTTVLGNNFERLFVTQLAAHERRLRYLVYTLTMAGENVADPAFLSRPSYALRAQAGHLRNHDSWKIVSRFRYIYQMLSAESKQDLFRNCMRPFPKNPDDAEHKVIQTWEHWRSWDLKLVKNSLAMKVLYGRFAGTVDEDFIEPKRTLPIEIGLRTGSMKVIIDPGPKQSDFGIEMLTVGLAMAPPETPTGLMLLPDEKFAQMTTVQLNASSMMVRLNWEICGLVENMLKTFNEHELFHRSHPIWAAPSAQPGSPDRTTNILQVIACIESGVISLDTIHLRSVSSCQGLKLSVLANDSKPAVDGIALTIVVHAEAATTDLSSKSKLLLALKAEDPTIFVARETDGTNDTASDLWRVAGSTTNVLVRFNEEILGIIEVCDQVLRHEIAYLHSQILPYQDLIKPKDSAAEHKPATPLPKFSLSLLMDSYRVDIALLQSLNYSLVGEVGRLAAIPDLNKKLAFTLDYDLGEQKHHLTSFEDHTPSMISDFGLPRVNGRLTIDQGVRQLGIDVNISVEPIVIDAAAVHGMATTFGQKEVQNAFQAARDDIEVFTSHIQETFPKKRKENIKDKVSSDIVPAYTVRATLEGLEIKAVAPGKLPHSGLATMAFGLGAVQLRATNLLAGRTAPVPFPEIHAKVQRVFAELVVSDGLGKRRCGDVGMSAEFHCTIRESGDLSFRRHYRVQSNALNVNVYADTASTVVDVMNHLQDKIKEIDLAREKGYIRRLHQSRRHASLAKSSSPDSNEGGDKNAPSSGLFTSAFSLQLHKIQVSWIVGNSAPAIEGIETEYLIFSIKTIDLATKSEDSARLAIMDLQLQMTPASARDKTQRSANSALLPEMVFNVTYASTRNDRKLTFQAAGKELDLCLESQFVLPASVLQQSLDLAIKKVRAATATWQTTPTSTGAQRKNPFGDKQLGTLLVDAKFAGAVVHLQRKAKGEHKAYVSSTSTPLTAPKGGKYGQFSRDGADASTTLRAPGIAIRVQYADGGKEASLNAELRVNESSNTLHPTVVPLIVDISNSVKRVVQATSDTAKDQEPKPAQKFLDEDSILTTDPTALIGKTKLNIGLLICKQEFSMTCQPIARVSASARFDEIYLTANSVDSHDQGHFFAMSVAIQKFQASVQHVYSKESTFSFDVDSIVLSLLNSKHLSGTAGISAILKIYPTRTIVNGRQLQDFLLFREIWVPPDLRQADESQSDEPQEYLVQRYQQVAAAAAFPWNASIFITEMSVELDLGQAIGKSSLAINNMWATSKKDSDWEQNLCIGIDSIGIRSTGRMSGFVELGGFQVRTSIAWPAQQAGIKKTPLIQASVGFKHLRVKAAFDYQVFAVADIAAFHFLMYNAKEKKRAAKDRLVAILDGDKVHVFCVSSSAAQGLALFQAFERLVQENQIAYKQSLKEIEKFLQRKPTTVTPDVRGPIFPSKDVDAAVLKAPISLHTDVVVTLRSIKVGAFPSSFSDAQLFLLEASDIQARFAVALEQLKIHSGLGMTLGQLRVALASIPHPSPPKPHNELTVEDVTDIAAVARGGIILRVPKVIAQMETWQEMESNHIDYVFKSTFEGKVDVGWNYSRISFIRGMWNSHSRDLAARLGKPLPKSAVKITGGPSAPPSATESSSSAAAIVGDAAAAGERDAVAAEGETEKLGSGAGDQEKITAVVNVPQSKYEYTALEPPVIETPQLRDMGEATPPLEWIGLHRDRLPNVTHQIVIVTLLEVAKEVEDAYSRILGSS